MSETKNLNVLEVKKLMLERGINQKDLASVIGLSRQYLNMVLNGKVDLNIRKCVKIATELCVSDERILTEKGCIEVEEYREDVNDYYNSMMSQGF